MLEEEERVEARMESAGSDDWMSAGVTLGSVLKEETLAKKPKKVGHKCERMGQRLVIWKAVFALVARL